MELSGGNKFGIGGCATTCVAAEEAQHQWIGVNASIKAYDLVRERLDKAVARLNTLPTYRNEIHLKPDPPKYTERDVGERKTSFVYIISHPEYHDEYKVGISNNVQARLNSYQTGNSQRSYKLEFSLKTHLYRETEAHIHDYFENEYEWVKAD